MAHNAGLREVIDKTLPGASIRISGWTSKGPRNPRFSQGSHQIWVCIKRDSKSPRARRGFLRRFWGLQVRAPPFPAPAAHRMSLASYWDYSFANPTPQARLCDGRDHGARFVCSALQGAWCNQFQHEILAAPSAGGISICIQWLIRPRPTHNINTFDAKPGGITIGSTGRSSRDAPRPPSEDARYDGNWRRIDEVRKPRRDC